MEKPEGSTIIEHFTLGPLGCTCTIVGDRISGEAVVIDGGAETARVMDRLRALRLRPVHLLYTHAHIDHIGDSARLRTLTQAPTALHAADIPLSRTMRRQAVFLGLDHAPDTIFDHELLDGDEVRIGSCRLQTLHTPGHTPGSVSFAIEHGNDVRLLTGDTLFAGAVGRWDLGGTSLADIVRSIRVKLLPYPDTTIVIPGHGEATTIGTERRENPFLQELRAQ